MKKEIRSEKDNNLYEINQKTKIIVAARVFGKDKEIVHTHTTNSSSQVFCLCFSCLSVGGSLVWGPGLSFCPPEKFILRELRLYIYQRNMLFFFRREVTSSDDFDRPYECLSVRPYVFPSVRVVTISSLTADRSEEYFLITCRKHCHLFLPIWVVSFTFFFVSSPSLFQ